MLRLNTYTKLGVFLSNCHFIFIPPSLPYILRGWYHFQSLFFMSYRTTNIYKHKTIYNGKD